MSLPDRRPLPGLALAALFAAGLLSACTVRPLYMTQTDSTGARVGAAAETAQIGIKPVTTRYAQQVRNNLIFLFQRGAPEPANPRYQLGLTVTSVKEPVASVQLATVDIPTSDILTLTASYVLIDNTTKKVVSQGRRAMTASFDVPRQEFAAIRAERDAQDRAARELAEIINLAVAADLTKKKG